MAEESSAWKGRRFLGLGRRFQSRSTDRDRQTDVARRTSVREVLLKQQLEIVIERDGLSRRMAEAYASASALLDSSKEFSGRSASEEDEISKFETAASSARNRIARLETEIELFKKLIEMLDQ